MAINTETHNLSICRELGAERCSALIGISILSHFSQGSGMSREEDEQDFKIQR